MTSTCVGVEGYEGRYLSPANLSPFSLEEVDEATLFQYEDYWWVLWEGVQDAPCGATIHPLHPVHLNGLVQKSLKRIYPFH